MFDVVEQFKKLSRAYAGLKKEAESQAHTWRWATGDMLEVLPMQGLRQGLAPERWLDKPPRNKADHTYHGLDRDGNIVVMYSWGPSRGDRMEHFVRRDKDTIEHTLFGDWEGTGRIQLIACTLLRLEEGRAVAASSYHRIDAQLRQETYSYADGAVVRVAILRKRFPGTPHETTDHCHEELTYDDLAQLDAVVAVYPVGSAAYPKGRSIPVYRRPKRPETVASLAAIVETQLLRWIPRVVAGAKVRQPVYALVLGYGAENPLPPELGLGLESERRIWIKRHGAHVGQVLWDTEGFSRVLRPTHTSENAGLTRACDLLNLAIRQKKKHAAAQQLLNRVAARLMQRDWSDCLRPTPDFVVVASDIEGQNDVPTNLRASAGPEVFKAFRAKGWV
jgi:hypothetical protein